MPELSNIGQDCVLIVWDECTTPYKGSIEALDASLQDVRNIKSVMGVVTVLLAGNFM